MNDLDRLNLDRCLAPLYSRNMTVTQFRYIGITDECVQCQQCGKEDLKSTVVLAVAGRDGGQEEVTYYGSVCAARALGIRGGGRWVTDAARAAQRRTVQAANFAREQLAFYRLPEAGDAEPSAIDAAAVTYAKHNARWAETRTPVEHRYGSTRNAVPPTGRDRRCNPGRCLMGATGAGMRQVGTLTWTAGEDGGWEAATPKGDWWLLRRHSRRDGHFDRAGWYVTKFNDDSDTWWQWAGRLIDHAFQVATVIAQGDWHRTGLREHDGTPTWRNAAGEVRPEPGVLATLVTDDTAPGAAHVVLHPGLLGEQDQYSAFRDCVCDHEFHDGHYTGTFPHGSRSNARRWAAACPLFTPRQSQRSRA